MTAAARPRRPRPGRAQRLAHDAGVGRAARASRLYRSMRDTPERLACTGPTCWPAPRIREYGGMALDSVRSRPASPVVGRRVSVVRERTVDAPMERVWMLLRDYAQARPRILPEQFGDYV